LKALVQKRHNPQFCALLLKIKSRVLSSATVFLVVKLKKVLLGLFCTNWYSFIGTHWSCN
jgi:hypothetical protein